MYQLASTTDQPHEMGLKAGLQAIGHHFDDSKLLGLIKTTRTKPVKENLFHGLSKNKLAVTGIAIALLVVTSLPVFIFAQG
ncbi:MAG: hypothetical protein WCI79_00255 [Candidatus Saccharibacteria bacterium]